MAIKDPILFITVEEFKLSKYFNELLFDKVTTPDNEIWFAISVASSNIDYLSGFTISKKWPEIIPTDFTDNVQTATTNYVRFLLTKDVDYLRGQGSISQGGLTYSESNPDDPYFIPPEVFNCLRKIKEYPNIKGFNLKGIEPQKNNYFNKFISNCGEYSPLNAYIPYNNIKSLDPRTKITITHPQNILRPIVNIDTNSIKTIDTLQTNELFTKYFSNDTFQLVDGKLEQQTKVISINNNVPNILINEATYDTLKTNNKTVSGAINELKNKNVDLTDYYKKEETNELLDNKQNKLTFNEEFIGFFENSVFIKAPELGKNVNNNQVYDELTTQYKNIVGAINEINAKQPKPTPNNKQWKEVGIKVNKSKISYNFIVGKKYKVTYIWDGDTQPIAYSISKEFDKLLSNKYDCVYTLDSCVRNWNLSDNRIELLKLEVTNNIIRITTATSIYSGNILKLEELQE